MNPQLPTTTPGPERALPMHLLMLCGLTLAALGARLWGIGFLLPHDLEGDARLLYQVRVLRGAHPEGASNRHYGQYPLLLAYLEPCLPTFDSNFALNLPPTSDPQEHLKRASSLALRGRTLIACIGTLLVPATYFLARRFARSKAALLSATFVAFSPLHLDYSQQARPHAAFALFAVASLLASLALVRQGSLKRWLLHGLACSFALGTLQSGIALLVPWSLAALMRWRSDRVKALPGLLCSTIALLSALPLYYPFLFWRVAGADSAQLELEGSHLLQAGHVIQFESFRGLGFARLFDIFWNYEPWHVVGVTWAVLACCLRRCRRGLAPLSREFWLCLSFFLSYAVVLGLYDRTVARFCTPLIPCAAILTSGAMLSCWDQALPRAQAVLRAIPALLLLVPAVATGLRQSQLRSRPDTQTEAARWIEEQLKPERDRLAAFLRVQLPLLRREGPQPHEGTELPMNWDAYEASHREQVPLAKRWQLWSFWSATVEQRRAAQNKPAQFFGRIPADIVVLQPMREPKVAAWHNQLVESVRNTGQLLLRISPDQNPHLTDTYLHYDEPQRFVDAPHRTLRIWQARCFGPVLEIYRLRP